MAHDIMTIINGLRPQFDTGYAVALHVQYTRPKLLFVGYSDAWADHYSAKGYMLIDPVVRWCMANSGWVSWDSLADPDGVLADARRFGIENGITCCVGDPQSRSFGNFSRSTGAFGADEAEELLALTQKLHDMSA